MTEISSFWAGAMLHGQAAEVHALVEAGVEPEVARVRDLVGVGVDPDRARRWIATRGSTSRGALITCCDARYPARLARLPDPPPALLVEGDPACLALPRAAAIVGTRGCTAYGRSMARTLGRALAAEGVLVVSGLARGVDAYAHQGALEAGRTLAVLGHGLAHTAPASNRRLRADLVARGGLVVSVWPDAFEPARWTFPRRNRWIAALSDHVVVVEAPARSGALITAEEALSMTPPEREQSPVWAVPGQVGAPASAGCLQLLAEGARVVVSVERCVAEIAGRGRGAQLELAAEPPWLDRLCAGASLDDVARMRGIPTLQLVREVTRLELAGVLVRLPGQRYARGGSSRSAPHAARAGAGVP